MNQEQANIFEHPFNFEQEALRQFRLQYRDIPVYRQFVDLLKIRENEVDSLQKIPFMPVEFFKTHDVIRPAAQAQEIFTSSGTTGLVTSRHYVRDISLYESSFRHSFDLFYGPVSDYCVLALLPAYLEREGSSLVFMARDLIARSGHVESGFYLNDYQKLLEVLGRLESEGQKTLLLGVSFALLDLAEALPEPMQFRHTLVMETGGMKGRRREMVRAEMHEILCHAFGLEYIHSEYGMTELLSQAWSTGNGIFRTPPWMKITLRDSKDPLSPETGPRAGGINVTDLANVNSCSFLATQDLGRLYPDGSFEVLGRFDASDIRGCNLLVEAV